MTGHVFCISAPIVGSSLAQKVSPRSILSIFDIRQGVYRYQYLYQVKISQRFPISPLFDGGGGYDNFEGICLILSIMSQKLESMPESFGGSPLKNILDIKTPEQLSVEKYTRLAQ